jgi:hypothetical protein
MSYNKKAIADALSKMNKARKPKQVNDIIMDPEGQNKFPGLPTRIPSNNITMETTPYPVLGVDNFGNQQMMYPGANYTFPGADYVDEYPMMQKGGQRPIYVTPVQPNLTSEVPPLNVAPIDTPAPTITTNIYKPTPVGTGDFITYLELQQNYPDIHEKVKNNWHKDPNRIPFDEYVEMKLWNTPASTESNRQAYTGDKTWEEINQLCPECLLTKGKHYERDENGNIYFVQNTAKFPLDFWEKLYDDDNYNIDDFISIDTGSTPQIVSPQGSQQPSTTSQQTTPTPQQPSETPESSEPKIRYHREWNPYTNRYEPMSPKQRIELDRLHSRDKPMPENWQPVLLDERTRQPVKKQTGGAIDWKSRIAATLNYQKGGLVHETYLKAKQAQKQPVVNNTTVRPSTGYTGFRDEGALIYNPVEITAKDKWGRQSGQSAWFGFDPEKNEFTTADRWGRKPGDPQYGYDSERDIWTMGSKGSKKVNIKNPYIFDDKDIENPNIQKQADECLIDPVTGRSTCLGSSFRYYDKYVAPNLGIPNSWQIKEKAGLSSGKTHSKFNDVGESWDSWELAAGLKDAGAKVFYTGGKKGKGWNPDEDEWRNLKLPIGTIINWGTGGRSHINNQETYNEKKGLAPSNHSTIIVGYDKTGLPIMQDYGKIKRVTNPSFPGVGVTNIIAPKEVLDKTYDKLKTDKLATGKTEYKSLSKKKLRESVDKLAYLETKPNVYFKDGKAVEVPSTHTNFKEMHKFADLLADKKEKYMSVIGLDNNTYDEYARRALAVAFVETRGGDETIIRQGLPAYKLKKMGFTESHGLTQIRHDINIWDNPTLSKKMNKLGITKENYDPYKVEHIVPATMLMLKNTDRTAQINLKKYPGNNLEMHPAMVNYYQWNRPGTFVRGEAQGNAIAAKRFMNYYNNIELQKGGQLSSEEFERRKEIYKKMTGRDFEPPKSFKQSPQAREYYQNKYNQLPVVQSQSSETTQQSRGVPTNYKRDLDQSVEIGQQYVQEQIDETNRQRIEDSRTFFEADNRSNAQRERDQTAAKQITDPTGWNKVGHYIDAATSIGGNLGNTIFGGDDWKKSLQNFETFQLNPYISKKDKLLNRADMVLSNVSNAFIDIGTAELGFAIPQLHKASFKKLLEIGSKANQGADVLQGIQGALDLYQGDASAIGDILLNVASYTSKMDNFDASTVYHNLNNWNKITKAEKIDTAKDIFNLFNAGYQQSQRTDPMQPYPLYQQGGTTEEELTPAQLAMMKARLAYAHMHSNPSAQRMVAPVDNPYIFTGTEPYASPDTAGYSGTHYMFSQGPFAVPTIQTGPDGQLYYNVNASPNDSEAMQFDSPEDAEVFARYYKTVAPAFQDMELTDEEIEEYKRGGCTIVKL